MARFSVPRRVRAPAATGGEVGPAVRVDVHQHFAVAEAPTALQAGREFPRTTVSCALMLPPLMTQPELPVAHGAVESAVQVAREGVSRPGPLVGQLAGAHVPSAAGDHGSLDVFQRSSSGRLPMSYG